MSLGFTEIIVIALFILLVFGAKRIPELARALGRASYEFKKAKNELSQESKDFVEAAEDAASGYAQALERLSAPITKVDDWTFQFDAATQEPTAYAQLVPAAKAPVVRFGFFSETGRHG